MTEFRQEPAGVPRTKRSFSWLNAVLGAAGLGSMVMLWWVGDRFTTFIPSISEVFGTVPQFLGEKQIWPDVLATIERVFGSLAVALAIGFGAAYLMRRGGLWGQVAGRYVSIMLGVPSTIAALLALFIFKRSEVGVYFVVSIITFPFVTLTLLEGLRAADQRLDQMGTVYRFSTFKHIRHVVIPHLVPYTFAAVRNEYAHAWKVVVLAELFAVNTGMGARFARAFDRFLLVDAMHWMLLFMLILLGTEYLVLLPVERRITRWRGTGRELTV